jgi:acylphosphatase
MKKHIECIIIGRVQMVMFRDFAQRKARKRSIVGFVKNNDDGSVFITAEGEEKDLLSYIADLGKGPILARVDHVEVQWGDPLAEHERFLIRYS